MKGKVIYLTGAPAAGKSTLGEKIKKQRKDVEFISYSEELIHYVNNRDPNAGLDSNSIREQSATTITPEDVEAVDSEIVRRCNQSRKNINIIIDSHPVTKEEYGFRITGFKSSILKDISIDIVICLYAAPDIIYERIKSDPGGRPLPSIYELETHNHAQTSLAINYGILSNCPVYLIDSDREIDELYTVVTHRCKLDE